MIEKLKARLREWLIGTPKGYVPPKSYKDDAGEYR